MTKQHVIRKKIKNKMNIAFFWNERFRRWKGGDSCIFRRAIPIV